MPLKLETLMFNSKKQASSKEDSLISELLLMFRPEFGEIVMVIL